jgi:3',5'-cyclic AMP phosphodiesterase CpdA
MNHERPAFDRRSIIKLGLAAGASLAGLSACTSSARQTADAVPGGTSARRSRSRVARIAHFTDTHIQPELAAGRGVAQALHHAQSMNDPPSLIVTGGDLVMDAYDQPAERTKEVFDLFGAVLRADCSIPVRHTLGNHDIWGWNKPKSGLTGSEALYGKAYALDRLGMAAPYHWFDVGGSGASGWRVIVLDSVRPSREPGNFGYEAFLDEPQRAWLEGTLRDTPSNRWVMVVSHIPIISASSLFDNDEKIALRVQSSVMHDDARALHDLFTKYPNVRLALSGHIHQIDRVEYAGLTYICGGAVSGAWWKGVHRGCHEGFGVVDLYNDGTHNWSYETYGWKAEA